MDVNPNMIHKEVNLMRRINGYLVGPGIEKSAISPRMILMEQDGQMFAITATPVSREIGNGGSGFMGALWEDCDQLLRRLNWRGYMNDDYRSGIARVYTWKDYLIFHIRHVTYPEDQIIPYIVKVEGICSEKEIPMTIKTTIQDIYPKDANIKYIRDFIDIAISKDRYIENFFFPHADTLYLKREDKIYRLEISEGTQFDEDWPDVLKVFKTPLPSKKPKEVP